LFAHGFVDFDCGSVHGFLLFKRNLCMPLRHSSESWNRAPVMAPNQRGVSPCRSVPQLRSRR
jgi:hypothetical protein